MSHWLALDYIPVSMVANHACCVGIRAINNNIVVQSKHITRKKLREYRQGDLLALSGTESMQSVVWEYMAEVESAG